MLIVFAARSALADIPTDIPQPVQAFLENNCFDCHQGSEAEGGLDLESLTSGQLSDKHFDRWVRLFDRVHAGEMPPADYATQKPQEIQSFLNKTGNWLRQHQQQRYESLGRVRGKRLTNLQLERTLHDLLGIDIPLAATMPTDRRTEGFTTVAHGQAMSHFQLAEHLSVVDTAMDEAYRRATTPPDKELREMSAQDVARKDPDSRCREPEMLDGKAVVWNGRTIFYGRMPATEARESGWYRFKIVASSLNTPNNHGVWCTVRTGRCVASAPLLGWVGAFEAKDNAKEWTFEAWVPEEHMLEVRPGDRTMPRARFKGGQIGAGEGQPQGVPGLALHSVSMQRIHRGPDDDQVRQRLFGNFRLRSKSHSESAALVVKNEKRAAMKLMSRFAERAYRRPITPDQVQSYVAAVHHDLDEGMSLLEALRRGYRSLLCSPRFLYFHEAPGPLDDYALASRISYFLTSSMPDDQLLQAASRGRLNDQDVLRQQVARLIRGEGGRQFVRDFAHQWLDLCEIDFTEPDPKLYKEFDPIVQDSMVEETCAFLTEMLQNDLSVSHLIDSEFTYLNERLARYYRIKGVEGDQLRRVRLKRQDHRGGVLTQGAILKVTANGTTTSPVIRGAWVSERLLGLQIPPPPESVPSIEPDIRGATSIRDMLAKHKAEDSCASCHAKMDPPGFALENFDPAGQWRDRYLGSKTKQGPKVDPSYELPDGQAFDNLEEFRHWVLADKRSLARNLAEKLITYGTGAPVGFADRKAVEKTVQETVEADYGFRSILEAVVTSSVFRNL